MKKFASKKGCLFANPVPSKPHFNLKDQDELPKWLYDRLCLMTEGQLKKLGIEVVNEDSKRFKKPAVQKDKSSNKLPDNTGRSKKSSKPNNNNF